MAHAEMDVDRIHDSVRHIPHGAVGQRECCDREKPYGKSQNNHSMACL